MNQTIAHDLNAEGAILSCIINDNSLLGNFVNRINPDIFYRKRNVVIYKTMKKLYSNDEPIDIISIRNHIFSNYQSIDKTDLDEYLMEISDMFLAPTKENLNQFIKIVIDKYQIRTKEKMAQTILHATSKPTDYTFIKDILRSYNVLSIEDEELLSITPEALGSIIKTANKEDLEAIEQGVLRTRGLPTGFKILDKFMRMRPKNVYCIAARPSLGKTSLMLKIILNLIMMSYRVMLISLEMSKEELMEKLISMTHGISNDDFRNLHPSGQIKLRNELSEFLGLNINNLVIDDYSTDINEIKNSIYNQHKTKQLDLVVVDYLQLININNSSENRNQEVTKISRILKSDISTKLIIPVLELSQLNRGLENRSNKRPMLSDLRESGSLEQDMTTVLFIYRDEEYGNFVDKNGKSTKGVAEISISKNRFGPKGILKLKFINEFALFQDL